MQDTLTHDLAGFIAKHGITMTATPVDNNPHMDDMPRGSQHYHCTLECDGRQLTAHYSVGPGIVENWLRDHGPANVRATMNAPHNKRTFAVKSIWAEEFLAKHRHHYRPDVADVLDCLASDASTIDNARYFEEWAEELGYDPDSRKAEGIYKTVQKQAAALEDLLGCDAFQTLLYEVERL